MIGHTRTRLKTGVTRVSGVTNDHNQLNLLNLFRVTRIAPELCSVCNVAESCNTTGNPLPLVACRLMSRTVRVARWLICANKGRGIWT